MVDFRKKTIGPKDAFGTIFRRRREGMNMSLGTAAKRTGIPRHYLSALEDGRYGELPGLVYGKSFVRVYGTFLQLSASPLLRAFVDEYTVAKITGNASKEFAKNTKAPRVFVTPFRIRMALAIFLFSILGVYFGGEIIFFVQPPALAVVAPEDQLITTSPEIVVAGSVDPRASLTVNNVAIGNERGNFSIRVPLELGMNTIHVRAFRRHGKETAIVRNVVRNVSIVSLK